MNQHPEITPQQAINLLRIIDLIHGDLYRTEEEIARFGLYVDRAKRRYGDLRRTGIEAAHDIVRAEAICDFLGVNPQHVEVLVKTDFAERQAQRLAEIKAITDANGDLPWEDHT